MKRNDKNKDEYHINLDFKDKKLLFGLDFEGRKTYSQLAKEIGLSKQGTEYKLMNLINKGVIKGFYPIINVPRLGYTYCRLLVTLQNMTKESYNEIVEYLKKDNRVFWLFQMQGIYDLLIVIWVKQLSEFREFREDLQSRYGNNIKRATENIATDVIHYQHRYLMREEKTKEIHLKESSDVIKIDNLDRKIIDILSMDGRISLVEIAKRVKESAKVIAYRIKGLEKKRLIEGYRPVINHSRIGFTYYKVFISLNKTSKEELKRLKAYIRSSPLVIYHIEGIALPADIDIEMMVKDNEELFRFIEDLRYKFPTLIGEYQTVIFIDTLKVKYLPF